MTFDAFTELSELEKINVLITEGLAIGTCLDQEHRIFLYQVDTFYVMATYHMITDELLSLKAFEGLAKKPSPAKIIGIWAAGIK